MSRRLGPSLKEDGNFRFGSEMFDLKAFTVLGGFQAEAISMGF